MADEPSKTPGIPAEHPSPQMIPLSKIHDLPGMFIQKQPDKNYGGLVSSIQASGVKEPVILRLREDGEYQLVAGYRRRRACELAKFKEIPAYVYEMTMKEAREYHAQVNNKPSIPIPGKLVNAPSKTQTAPKGDRAPEAEKTPEQPAPGAPGKKGEEPAPQAEQTAPKEGKSPEAEKKPEQTIPAAPSKKADEPAPKAEQPAPKEGKTLEGEKKPETVVKAVGMAAKGPAGTQITQVFEDRLSPPDDKELKNLPTPKEGESYFIVLHPGYLEKSKFNTVSVDQNSEDYRELKKSIELNGVKDPVLTRINPDGGLEILSGQRRHMIARELNYPVPAIIQKIDDADAKILVSDGNLHRPKISTYDLSRTLRMKMEGMKQKAGRRKKGFTAEELNSDEKLAKEMGMSVSIFCVIPDSNDVSLNFLVGMLYTQAFQELYFQADKVHGGSLPIPVRLMFDEFANVALPDGYARLQATMRSRNVMATIILQNISQLKELFKDSWEGIIGNADAFVYLGGNEQSTHKYVSELLGKETIETRTSSQSRGRNGSYSQNFQQAGRELLTPDEVRMLDNRYALVLLRGEAPVIDEKYDLMRHPNIKLTADGGAAPYIHSPRCLYAEEDLDFIFTSLDDIEIIDEMEES